MHVRQQIINAVITAVTGLPLTGSRVHFAAPHALTVLPALSVVWDSDAPDGRDGGDGDSPAETRALRVLVTAKAMSSLTVGADLSDIAADVEAAVLGSSAVRALVHLIEYDGATPQYSGELQQPIGEVEIAFQVLYRIEIGNPETVVP